jgi:hypothetical protein
MPRLSEQAQQEIERSRTQGNDPLKLEWSKEVTDLAQELLSCSANDLNGWDPDRPLIDLLPELVQSMVGNVIGLPQRWLNHASVNELWWCFVSSWHNSEAQERGDQKMPTRPTFMLRWHAVWKQLLLFRKKFQHNMYTTCFDLLQVLRGNRGPAGLQWEAFGSKAVEQASPRAVLGPMHVLVLAMGV